MAEKQNSKENKQAAEFAFRRENYILIIHRLSHNGHWILIDDRRKI